MSFSLEKYAPLYREAMIEVWEESVWATHHFLAKNDIIFYRALVELIDFEDFVVYVCLNDSKELIGFLGVYEGKLEMLFLKPTYIGKRIGKQMMQYALEKLAVSKVDVNEGNQAAYEFYARFGFKVLARKPLDDCGKPYPILQMSL